MFNKVIIIGNLTSDVELRYFPSGGALATIKLASNRRFNKQDGSKGEEVCFIDAKLFGRTAEIANQYLHKGSKVLIEGRLTYETWTDQNGSKRSKHVITAENMQMLDSKNQQNSSVDENINSSQNSYTTDYKSEKTYETYKQPQTSMQGGNKNSQENIPSIDIDDDEIPF